MLNRLSLALAFTLGIVVGLLVDARAPVSASFSPSIVRSVQRGTIVIAAADSDGINTATLSTTLTSTGKTLCTIDGYKGGNTASSGFANYTEAALALTNTTTITGHGSFSGGPDFSQETIYYTCIEFF